ncbi:hypothetical protein [Pontiella agarivorans]|uniref:Uncharacterized protein n=1 Tax=Pontiella agarivorans TaxID=3038953 RepID=A0ABU5N1S3_9BACT|nr:hypothetical protein [Pontiella agarivorans]MDZ8120404.1 hypothetical protein [Pontiella agarivorans]
MGTGWDNPVVLQQVSILHVLSTWLSEFFCGSIMQADGFSLDDKRQPVDANDIPDIVARYLSLE